MMDDYTAVAIAEGFQSAQSYGEYVDAWQHLHNTGLAYRLQGWFGRTAQRLIEEGVIEDMLTSDNEVAEVA